MELHATIDQVNMALPHPLRLASEASVLEIKRHDELNDAFHWSLDSAGYAI